MNAIPLHFTPRFRRHFTIEESKRKVELNELAKQGQELSKRMNKGKYRHSKQSERNRERSKKRDRTEEKNGKERQRKGGESEIDEKILPYNIQKGIKYYILYNSFV